MNQLADNEETWYGASVTQAHYILFKCIFWVGLHLFMARPNFANSAFIWENVTMMDSMKIIAAFYLELALYSKLNNKIKDY